MKPTSTNRPLLNLGPVPDEGSMEVCKWLREIAVTLSPLMHHLRPRNVETRGNFVSADDVAGINSSSHSQRLGGERCPGGDDRTHCFYASCEQSLL